MPGSSALGAWRDLRIFTSSLRCMEYALGIEVETDLSTRSLRGVSQSVLLSSAFLRQAAPSFTYSCKVIGHVLAARYGICGIATIHSIMQLSRKPLGPRPQISSSPEGVHDETKGSTNRFHSS